MFFYLWWYVNIYSLFSLSVCLSISLFFIIFLMFIIFYNLEPGNWSAWINTTACNQTCGTGYWQVERRCDNPAPIGDGANCTDTNGNPSVYELIWQKCNTHDCPGIFLHTLLFFVLFIFQFLHNKSIYLNYLFIKFIVGFQLMETGRNGQNIVHVPKLVV